MKFWIVILGLVACACSAQQMRIVLDRIDPSQAYYDNPGNFHDCLDKNGKPDGTKCAEWWYCVPGGCEFWGDPNGPGPGDVDKEGSFAGDVP